MLKIVEGYSKETGIVYQVAYDDDIHPVGAWAVFSDAQVAQNFRDWLSTLDIAGLTIKYMEDRLTESDIELYQHIMTRRKHVTQVDTSRFTKIYQDIYLGGRKPHIKGS